MSYIKKITILKEKIYDEIEIIDRLQDMFDKQIYFQKKYFNFELPQKIRNEISHQVAGLIGELGEILHAYKGWKTWKKDMPKYDNEKLLLEVVDLWHFVINLTLFLGFNVDELYKMFLIKNQINCERQDNE